MLAGGSYGHPMVTEKPNQFDWSEQKRSTQRTHEGNQLAVWLSDYYERLDLGAIARSD